MQSLLSATIRNCETIPLASLIQTILNAKARNPFYWQRMIFSRDQPRTLEVLGELRALVDQYSERYLIGEVLDVDMIAVSSKYTRTGKHLHSCYTFEFMQQRFDASLLRRAIELTEESLGTGWTSWAMSNHDNIRVVSRFGSSEHLAGADRALAKVLLAALLTIRGGACVYQGEELGLTEAEIDGFETYSVLVNPNRNVSRLRDNADSREIAGVFPDRRVSSNHQVLASSCFLFLF